MKVHPIPKKRNMALRYNVASSLSRANGLACRQKKLRRLPHIFTKVLELPFHSDADVSVEETSNFFRFVVTTDDIAGDVRAQTVEIIPGVTKIVVGGYSVVDLSLGDLELDFWRFRLPALTLPELASASYVDGELVVTVPKGLNSELDGDGQDSDFGFENPVLVQIKDKKPWKVRRFESGKNWNLFISGNK